MECPSFPPVSTVTMNDHLAYYTFLPNKLLRKAFDFHAMPICDCTVSSLSEARTIAEER